MEMLNWLNNDNANMGSMAPPVMRVASGRKYADFGFWDTWGFWCRKTIPLAQVQPNPRNRTPYTVGDAHFSIAVVSATGTANNGIVFQASNSGHVNTSELRLVNSQPQAKVLDQQGTQVLLTSPARLVAGTPAVVTLTSVPGAQRLRVNSTVVGSDSATLAASPCDQLLIGWGFTAYYPREPFNGGIYSVITGAGAPSSAELAVLERYLAAGAGVAI